MQGSFKFHSFFPNGAELRKRVHSTICLSENTLIHSLLSHFCFFTFYFLSFFVTIKIFSKARISQFLVVSGKQECLYFQLPTSSIAALCLLKLKLTLGLLLSLPYFSRAFVVAGANMTLLTEYSNKCAFPSHS